MKYETPFSANHLSNNLRDNWLLTESLLPEHRLSWSKCPMTVNLRLQSLQLSSNGTSSFEESWILSTRRWPVLLQATTCNQYRLTVIRWMPQPKHRALPVMLQQWHSAHHLAPLPPPTQSLWHLASAESSGASLPKPLTQYAAKSPNYTTTTVSHWIVINSLRTCTVVLWPLYTELQDFVAAKMIELRLLCPTQNKIECQTLDMSPPRHFPPTQTINVTLTLTLTLTLLTPP